MVRKRGIFLLYYIYVRINLYGKSVLGWKCTYIKAAWPPIPTRMPVEENKESSFLQTVCAAYPYFFENI
jgi:hypothetical protein